MSIVNDTDRKRLFKTNPLFRMIHAQFGSPPNWSRPPGFISLSKIILEQQVSLASANAHFQKLNAYIPEFSPRHILHLSDEEMRACQISRQKTKYLRALAHAIVQGDIDLDALSCLPEADIRSRLIQIKGIGQWTADVYLMFCLQAKDVFPIGDIAIVNTVKELTSANSKEEIMALAEAWRPVRSLASFYCWHYYLCKRNRS